MSNGPDYRLIGAADQGRTTAYRHIVALGHNPNCTPPKNPYTADDPAHNVWLESFNETLTKHKPKTTPETLC